MLIFKNVLLSITTLKKLFMNISISYHEKYWIINDILLKISMCSKSSYFVRTNWSLIVEPLIFSLHFIMIIQLCT